MAEDKIFSLCSNFALSVVVVVFPVVAVAVVTVVVIVVVAVVVVDVVVVVAVVVVDALLGRDRQQHDTTHSGWVWI